MSMRIGIGYDIHSLEEGRKLILGGIHIPFDKGLKGHSDGDALLHAIADAMLGALALGDIGKHFPDTDERFRGADSADLLANVVGLVRDRGYTAANIDANIIAQQPKLMKHIDAMRERISDIVGIPMDAVSVKARTNEGLDAVGRGEAIATQAIVLVE
jgi:2-C-methyl-D-erythritol 2,4-cyclodiphosphate synthase